jgi:glycopeptide antibiotics resistance protein
LSFSISDIHSVREINLIPFRYEDVAPGDIPILEALMNYIVFVPFGYFLSRAFWNIRFFKKVIIALLLSSCFEVIQYILAIGASDIIDIITNTVGGIAGIAIVDLTRFFADRH